MKFTNREYGCKLDRASLIETCAYRVSICLSVMKCILWKAYVMESFKWACFT